LADSETAKIFEIITKGMILLGVKGDRLPSEFEMNYMSRMMKVDFANLPIGEFELAFDLMIKNKLDESAETFQNFSALYLSRMMSSYARWAYKNYQPEVIEKQLQAPQVSDDEILNTSFEYFKKRRDWQHIFNGLRCFNIIHKRGLVTDFEGTLKRTEEALKESYRYADHKEKKELLKNLDDDEFMELACRRMAVAEYFKKLM
jgi:hypothetical protein